jgi:alkylhydroperoxidase family enzyme
MSSEQSTRISVPSRDAVDAGIAALLELATPPGGEPPPTVAVLALRPALLGPFLGWAAALALEGALPQRDHELLALRVAWYCQSAFEWGEHVRYGRRAGLSDDEIADVASGPDAGWGGHEAVLLRAVDELCARCLISEEIWAGLAARYEPAALVEIPYVVGQYTMLSMVANGLGIQASPGDEVLPPR